MPVKRNIFLDRLLKHLKIKNPLQDTGLTNEDDVLGMNELNKKKMHGGWHWDPSPTATATATADTNTVSDLSETIDDDDIDDKSKIKISSGFYIFDVLSGNIIGLVINRGDKYLYMPNINEINIQVIRDFIETGESNYTFVQLLTDLSDFLVK